MVVSRRLDPFSRRFEKTIVFRRCVFSASRLDGLSQLSKSMMYCFVSSQCMSNVHINVQVVWAQLGCPEIIAIYEQWCIETRGLISVTMKNTHILLMVPSAPKPSYMYVTITFCLCFYISNYTHIHTYIHI